MPLCWQGRGEERDRRAPTEANARVEAPASQCPPVPLAPSVELATPWSPRHVDGHRNRASRSQRFSEEAARPSVRVADIRVAV